jgi:hypothetical protein
MPLTRTVEYKIFRGTFASWEDLFTQATTFATTLGDGRLISISHSADHSDGVVAVWYWAEPSRSAG